MDASSPLLKRLLFSSLPVRSMALPASSRISRSNAAAHVYGDFDGDASDFEGDASDFDGDASFFGPFFGGYLMPEGPKSSPGIQKKQTAEGLHLQMDMPGLSKEDVTLTVVENTLIVKGEGKNAFEVEDGIGRSYSAEFDLPPKKNYKIEAIKAEMKNGVLKAFVPKIKDEERANVFKVSIE